MPWWSTLVTAAMQWIGNATGRHFGIAAGLAIVLLGILCGSTALIVFGGAILFFLIAR